MKRKFVGLLGLSTAAVLLAGCHSKPIKTTEPTQVIQANYGIEGFEADEGEVPMPEPVDVSAPAKIEASYGIEGFDEVDEDIPMPQPVDLKQTQPVAQKETAIKAYTKAIADNQKTKELGFSWNVTPDLLKDAKTALDANDYKKAISLAKKASGFAIAGQKQHALAQSVNPRYYSK